MRRSGRCGRVCEFPLSSPHAVLFAGALWRLGVSLVRREALIVPPCALTTHRSHSCRRHGNVGGASPHAAEGAPTVVGAKAVPSFELVPGWSGAGAADRIDRKSTRLNFSHVSI